MKIFFGDKFVNGIKVLYNKPNRALVSDTALLSEFDVLATTGMYLKRSGISFEVSGKQERASKNVWNNFLATIVDYTNEGKAKVFYSMQGAKEKLFVEAMLLNIVNERILRLENEYTAALGKKSSVEKSAMKLAKKDLKQENGQMVNDDAKAVYKKNREEAVALWSVLAAKVIKNYYDYQMAVNNKNDEPRKPIVVSGKNVDDIIKKLYHGKFTKLYPISNYPNRDEIFAREFPKFIAENRRDFMNITHGIYDIMVREINFGPVDSYTLEDDSLESFGVFSVNDVKEKKSSKFAKRATAAVVAASLLFNSVGYPIGEILELKEKGDAPVVTPQVPDEPQTPDNEEKDENIIITDNPDLISPNPAEDEEEVQENIGENGTIIPDKEPETEGEEKPEKDPSYDMPNDTIPEENTSNNNKGDNADEDFWFMS